MKLLSLVVLAALVSTTAFAGRKSERRQEKRIQQGVESGQLTKKEAAYLQRGQEKVDNAQERAKADGKVTRKERKQINNIQDNQSRKIYKQKHDRQNRH